MIKRKRQVGKSFIQVGFDECGECGCDTCFHYGYISCFLFPVKERTERQLEKADGVSDFTRAKRCDECIEFFGE